MGILNSVGTQIGSSFLPSSEVLKTAGRYGSIVTGALMIFLGIISMFFGRYIIGPICIALGGFMLIVEFAVPFAAKMEFFAMIFDYKIRGIIYLLFCIPPFIGSPIALAAALGCLFSGGVYCVLGFIKNEQAELPKYDKQRDVESGNGSEHINNNKL